MKEVSRKRPTKGLFFFRLMERHVASLRLELTMPERNKFTAPLFLLHGLWVGSWMWREMAAAFSLRGWECWALDLRGRPGSRPVEAVGKIRLEDYLADVATVAEQLWASPIVCGHDLGGLLALLTMAQVRPRAVICVAPLVPRSWNENIRPPAPLVRLGAVPALLWGRPLSPPRLSMARDFLFNGMPPAVYAQIYSRLQPDSGTIARALAREPIPFSPVEGSCPVLVISGGADRMSPAMAIRWLVQHLHTEHRDYPGQGHWFFTGEQGKTLAGDVHRWLIRALGETLLIPPEEAEE
jgi:pimeloyl-ACP methyl ester carboxylesterase